MGCLGEIEVLIIINFKRIQPSSAYLAQPFLDVLLARANGLLALLAFEEVVDEVFTHSYDLALNLIRVHPLVLGKYP